MNFRCNLCNVTLLKRYKSKHNQSKKHKYFSILILNRYVIKRVKVNEFKDIFKPYFINLQEKLFFFSVSVVLKFDDDDFDCFKHKISVSNNVTYSIESENYTTYTTEPAPDFLHRVIGIYLSHKCIPKIIPEIEIVFISDLKHISQQHYLEQPKSMLCRKLIRKFHESTSQHFKYKWLPVSFKGL